MNQQMSKTLANSMKLGGLANMKKLAPEGGFKAGELQVIASGSSKPVHVDDRLPRTLTGKAMLVVDAQVDETTGERIYSTVPRVKSCRGDHGDDAFLELKHFGTDKTVVPSQCRRMGDGDRWRIDVVYLISYEPTIDREGNKDWEVNLEFIKAKTRAKSPWQDRLHKRYVSKAKR